MVQASFVLWATPVVRQLPVLPAAAGSTSPSVVSMTGTTLIDPPPPSVEMNVIQSNTTTWLIAEQECVTLSSAVTVNRVTNGSFNGGSNEMATIPAGTTLSSFLLNADRSSNGDLVGSISFSSPIIGLIYELPQMTASNPTLGVSGMVYPTQTAAYVETNDDFTLSGGTLTWDMAMGGAYSDLVRILVECS